jgi:protein-S-isoprenylcysteine O-methyltransferase Ste14
MAAWSWGLLGAGGISIPNGVVPLFYPAFLTILLIHRAKRDEEKCLAKYGEGYREYMRLVQYKIFPGIY